MLNAIAARRMSDDAALELVGSLRLPPETEAAVVREVEQLYDAW